MSKKYEKYDNYDAYNLDKSKDIYEFLQDPEMIKYMLGGGAVGVPITFLDKYRIPNGQGLLVLDDLVRPLINGKLKYRRLIYKFNPDYIEALNQNIITVVEHEDGRLEVLDNEHIS